MVEGMERKGKPHQAGEGFCWLRQFDSVPDKRRGHGDDIFKGYSV